MGAWYVTPNMRGDATFGIVQRGTDDVIYLAYYEDDANDLARVLNEEYRRAGLS